MHNYSCDNCGASLDPGEHCDYEKQPDNVITMEMWTDSFDDVAKPGDYVTGDIVDEFLNSVPPVTFKAGFVQCGEPYSHRVDKRNGKVRATYITFVQHGHNWLYCGHCFAGETMHQE